MRLWLCTKSALVRWGLESTSDISALESEALGVCLSKTVFIGVHYSFSGRKPDSLGLANPEVDIIAKER